MATEAKLKFNVNYIDIPGTGFHEIHEAKVASRRSAETVASCFDDSYNVTLTVDISSDRLDSQYGASLKPTIADHLKSILPGIHRIRAESKIIEGKRGIIGLKQISLSKSI